MRLFDDVPRNDTDSAFRFEGDFEYLNRSARPEVEKVRQLLETWFSHYPKQEQPELRQRLKAEHSSAFYELFLHELLLKLECNVTIHPHKEDADNKSPDFLVKPPDGDCFYFEAVLATGETEEEKAAKNRIKAVYDYLDNNLNSPNFFIRIDHLEGSPRTQPPAKKLKFFLAERLDALDPDKIYELYISEGVKAVPYWQYEHDGWKIGIYPIPKLPEYREEIGDRAIALITHKMERHQNLYASIKKSIKNKTSKYGDFDKPYVIAVNILGEFTNEPEIKNALFGDLICNVILTESGLPLEYKPYRKPDSLWIRKLGPINTRVSAILFTKRLTPWNIPRAKICLYHNPWAKIPYSSVLTCLPQMVPQNNKLVPMDGKSLGDIFKFPLNWPED